MLEHPIIEIKCIVSFNGLSGKLNETIHLISIIGYPSICQE